MTELLLVVPCSSVGGTRTIATLAEHRTAQPVSLPQDGQARRRDDTAAPPTDPGVAPGTSQDGQPPQGQTQDPASCLSQNLPFILAMVAIFYFMLIRPAQKTEKKRRALMAALKKGDRVVTSSGIYGEILSLDQTTASLKVDRDVKLTFDRSAITRIVTDDSAALAAPRPTADS